MRLQLDSLALLRGQFLLGAGGAARSPRSRPKPPPPPWGPPMPPSDTMPAGLHALLNGCFTRDVSLRHQATRIKLHAFEHDASSITYRIDTYLFYSSRVPLHSMKFKMYRCVQSVTSGGCVLRPTTSDLLVHPYLCDMAAGEAVTATAEGR